MSAWRALLRVARRDALRHRGRSLLIVGLVAVPVAAMSASLTIGHSAARTPEQDASSTMGQADLSLRAAGVADGEWQAVLGPTARWTPVRTHDHSAAIVVGDELFEPTLFEADLADPLVAGMAEVVDGRAARTADEVVLSTALAGDLSVEVGDRLELARPDRAVTVVGTGVTPNDLEAPLLFVPTDWWDAGTPMASIGEGALWLIEVGDVDPGSVQAALGERFPTQQHPPGVTRVGPEAHAPPAAERSVNVFTRSHVLESDPLPDNQVSGTFVAGVLALVWTGAVAAAAFAVGARRRLREVGLLAAAGGAPRHLRRLLVADGVVLGLAGALGGVAGGALLAALARPHLDRLVLHAVPDLRVPGGLLAAAAAAGFVAAVVAALVPARAASHVPVLSALAGLRPRPARARSWLTVGVVALGAGVVLCWRGGRSGGEGLVNAGVLLVVFDVAALTSPALGLVGRMAGAAPLSLRLAARDAGRSRGRAGPATVAAMLALAGAVGGSAMLTSSEAQGDREYVPALRDDQVSLMFTGGSDETATPAEVDAVVAAATAALPGAVGGRLGGPHMVGDPGSSIVAGEPEPMGVPGGGDAFAVAGPGSDIAVGDAATLDALGAPQARSALDAGRVVALNGGTADAGGTVTVWALTQGRTRALETVPAVEVEGEALFESPRYLISAATAESLGLATRPSAVLVRAPGTVTDADVRRVNLAVLEAVPTVGVYTSRELGQVDAGVVVLPALLGAGALVALFVVGLVTALSREELRPHLATLAAVGAAPRSRRRVAAAQSGLLAGTAAMLAVPAGLIPAVTLLRARSVDVDMVQGGFVSSLRASPIVVPWLAIAGLVIGVTVVAMLGGGLCTRSRLQPGD